jgi:NADH-quinone oxidoreductase subunit L
MQMILNEVTPVAATGLFQFSWLMIAIPLAVAAILLLCGKAADKWGHFLGTLAPIASFVIALVLFITMMSSAESQRSVQDSVYTWIAVGNWSISISLLIDQLSILFALLVTGVGSLIFIYSIGYMAHDEGRRRFFGYLNIFVAAMLTLVLADNYVMLFIGWEGVGLASYLLIGFWQNRRSAALAAKKAFLVNKIGDLGLLTAIFIMFTQFGSVNFFDVNARVSGAGSVWVNLIGFTLLLAACGKSAQVPLQSWLLDAMEGPTPVSALIHAATMVTAGVYLVVRSHAIYALTFSASLAVAIVGTVTLLVGAWIGSAKDDIKKVLAGSTMSQIGYMMLAAGIGPAGAAFAIFHLLTHGAFKANMFLGAGSIMHGMNDDTNMRNFGALRKVMPWTFFTFACGYLAIIGFPFTGGFYSKDHIIVAAWDKSPVFGVLAIVGAGITAFYMTRLIMMTFFGPERWNKDVKPHESPAVMVVPLVVLGVLSLGLGLLMNNWIQGWLAPATGAEVEHAQLLEFSWQGIVTLVVVALGVLIGWLIYRTPISKTVPVNQNIMAKVGANELYANQFNDNVLIKPGAALADGVGLFDQYIVDGGIRAAGRGMNGLSGVVRGSQTGNVRSYGLVMIAGAVIVVAGLLIGMWV